MRPRPAFGIAAVLAFAGMAQLGACAHTRSSTDSLSLMAVAEGVPAPVGCGLLYAGSPVTFRVVSGPDDLVDRRIEAVVPCLDFSPQFYVAGRTYELQLTKQNLYKIEVWPDHLSDPQAFFLISARNRDSGESWSWPPSR